MAAPRTTDESPRLSWTALFLLFTAAGALRFSYFELDDLARDQAGTVVRRFIEEGTGAYSAMLLFPIIAYAERRFPLSSGRWRNWPWHIAAWIPFTIAHTALMAVSRSIIFPAIGYGAYDYGRMSVRFFMEAPEDLIGYASLVCLLTFLRVQQELRAREVRAATLERDAVAARLEALSSRLQPHFLFNALNTISSTVYDDPVAADEMIGKLGDLLRQALRASDRQEFSVAEELETLQAYLAFVDARFGDRVSCTVRADDNARLMRVPVFLLQPLVENAVRHGASSEYQHTNILIDITVAADRLRIVVENEITAPPTEARVGTGLGTTADRLRLLYGPAATLETSASDGRFRVSITIPAVRAPAPPLVHDTEHAGAHR